MTLAIISLAVFVGCAMELGLIYSKGLGNSRLKYIAEGMEDKSITLLAAEFWGIVIGLWTGGAISLALLVYSIFFA